MFRKRSRSPFAGELLVLVEAPPDLPPGTTTLQGDIELSLVGVDTAGERVLPVFSSERELVRWQPQGGPFVGLAGSLVAELALANGFDAVSVDPASSDTTVFSRDELAGLVGGS